MDSNLINFPIIEELTEIQIHKLKALAVSFLQLSWASGGFNKETFEANYLESAFLHLRREIAKAPELRTKVEEFVKGSVNELYGIYSADINEGVLRELVQTFVDPNRNSKR